MNDIDMFTLATSLPDYKRVVNVCFLCVYVAFKPGIHGTDGGGSLSAWSDQSGVQRPPPSEGDLHGSEQVRPRLNLLSAGRESSEVLYSSETLCEMLFTREWNLVVRGHWTVLVFLLLIICCKVKNTFYLCPDSAGLRAFLALTFPCLCGWMIPLA